MQRLLIAALLSLGTVVAVLCAPAHATGVPAGVPAILEELENIDRRADAVRSLIDEGSLETWALQRMLTTLQDQREEIDPLQEFIDSQLSPLLAEQAALGSAPADGATEAEEIAGVRAELSDRIAQLRGVALRLDQADARAEALINRLAEVRRDQFTSALTERGPVPVLPDTLAAGYDGVVQYLSGIGAEIVERLGEDPSLGALLNRLLLPVFLLLTGFGLAFVVRRWLVHQIIGWVASVTGPTGRAGLGIAITLVRLVLPVIALSLTIVAVRESGLFGSNGQLLLDGIADGLVILIGAYAFSSAYYAPQTPELRLSTLPAAMSSRAHRALMWLAGVVAIESVITVARTDGDLNVEAMLIANFVVLVFGGGSLFWFIRAAIRPGHDEPVESEEDPVDPDAEEPEDETQVVEGGTVSILRAIRFIGQTVAILAPLLAVAGFFAASRFVFYPPVFTGAVIIVCVLIYTVARHWVDRIAPEQGAASSSTMPGSAANRSVRLRIVPVVVGFFVTCAAIPVIAMIWGATASDLREIWIRVSNGFAIGDFVIAPAEMLQFIVVFTIVFLLTRLLQGVLRRSILPLTSLDTGGRAAVLAGVGYVGTIIAALIGVTAAGLDLSNLAILAGALSVGIGFGLQAIVSNFVSGIILLISRPIKAGDWIEVSSGQGYVKSVNVRSTEIETFDRSSLFVPNADLIASPVVNRTHSNSHGRLIVPVGVAYGTDARQVERILLEVARGHPMLMRRPSPFVIFSGFGASSLDFELRGVLRDVNFTLGTASDLRFEIYRRFMEEDIEIPFAQQDITIKNLSDLGAPRPGPSGSGSQTDETPE